MNNKKYSFLEEVFNSVTHGIGALLSIVALVILVVFGAKNNDVWQIVAFSIYGSSLVVLYLFSTLYHSFSNDKIKGFLQIFDHLSIFLLIAGTYTALTLTALRGAWGWWLFSLIWGIALFGIIFEIVFKRKYKKVSLALYILMGWLVVIAIKPMLSAVPIEMFMWLLVGGLLYTFGAIFYAIKKPYFHAIWHLFVLGGSVAHFFGVLFYLT